MSEIISFPGRTHATEIGMEGAVGDQRAVTSFFTHALGMTAVYAAMVDDLLSRLTDEQLELVSDVSANRYADGDSTEDAILDEIITVACARRSALAQVAAAIDFVTADNDDEDKSGPKGAA